MILSRYIRQPAPLYNYLHPFYAARTLAKLRAKWPENKFEIVPSKGRYVIRATKPDGTTSFVEKKRRS